ncbi:ankyrin repeat domain-containing protein [Rickettsiella endosymbiont of Dermanyssus gallinae]|uniref:ankyrin repeat domain-containing protein n=1 Tax=Rickettsiella endosymbiont of Dermanyssus gallinae TaxID=2856608 RepID=UPI001C531C92|nr:ankyrin repeat domain-containing protein [Rickettsiella endosymbiont of Dermanyssus gallinae]
MKEEIEKFKAFIIEGNLATVEDFLRKHQHRDVANWILNKHGESALHYLANEELCGYTPNREDLIRLLLRYGANINLKDKSGASPISEACFNFITPLIQIFIENGADVKEINDRGYTLLQSPVLHGETEIVDMLLEAGAGAVINTIGEDGDAIIHNALAQDTKDNEILKSLISAGANINMPDKKGQTLLHVNVLYYRSEVVNEILLDHGADYLVEDKNGMTALHYAAKENFYPLIDAFIKAKLSGYSAASIEEKKLILDDCLEKFKIILLENPLFFKPGVLYQSVAPSLYQVFTYLSNGWDYIQQELQGVSRFITAKLSEYREASTEKKSSILGDCAEKFKIVLLKNPMLLKPTILRQPVAPLHQELAYLSNRWDCIRQEIQAMEDKKMGVSDYSLYATLKLIDMLSNETVLASINGDTLKSFPNFSSRIEAVTNCVKKTEALPLGMTSRLFKLPTAESLSGVPLSNTSEEGENKAFKPA